MAKNRGNQADVRVIDAADMSAGERDRIKRKRQRITRAVRLARQQLAHASLDVVKKDERKARWFCLKIEGGREYSVEKLLIDGNVDAVLPREKFQLVKNGKKFAGERPLLPGYLLVRIVPSASAFDGLRQQRGVADFVGGESGYHVIPDREVGRFRVLSEDDVQRMEADKSIGEGCRAVVTSGYFSGIECVVLSVKWARTARGRVRLLVDGKAFDVENMPIAFLKRL